MNYADASRILPADELDFIMLFFNDLDSSNNVGASWQELLPMEKSLFESFDGFHTAPLRNYYRSMIVFKDTSE